ncbi:MAG: MarR family winged helix-turn-helix transcriptional regulator [Lautropia sp.]
MAHRPSLQAGTIPSGPSVSLDARPDHESRLAQDDHGALRLWLRLLTCTSLIEKTIRRRLQRDFASTLPRFDLLAQLEREDGLRMSELSQRLMVTGGNVTGIADQLEREDWIRREPVSGDRRATRLRLTADGRARFDAMAVEHERWVEAMMGALTREEQADLRRLLGKLKQHLNRHAGDE